MHPLSTRAQDYQVNDPCYGIGEVPHQLISRSKILYSVSQELYKWCHSNIWKCPSKNAKFKPQLSTSMQAFASMRSTPFMEIDDKGEEIVQRYALGEIETKK